MKRVALGLALLLGVLTPAVALAYCTTTIYEGRRGPVVCITCCTEGPGGWCHVTCN